MGIRDKRKGQTTVYENYNNNYNYNYPNGYETYRGNTPAGNGRQKKKIHWGKMILCVILCGLFFGATASVAFAGVNRLLNYRRGSAETAAVVSTQETVDVTEQTQIDVRDDVEEQEATETLETVNYFAGSTELSQSLDVSDIAEGMMPAMVSITNISVQEVQSYLGMFGRQQTQTQESQSSGTGIIIGENENELLIVTNNHVVEDSKTLSVCFVDEEVCEATIKGTDPDNDLAVISVKLANIPEETAKAIKVAKIGKSDALKVGQQVVAIGNALGYGQSVTTGIVSALGRQIDTTDAIMIQTDAAINPGNSGGALLNMDGEVIGINSAKFSSTEVEGMGYAISITEATPIIEDLMNRTTREKVSEEEASWIGISGESITSSIASAYGLPQGIYITYIDNESPLRNTGVTVQCILTHFDGIRVTSYSNLENRLQYYAAGESVEVTYQTVEGNQYVEKTVTVTLGSAAEHPTEQNYGFDPFGRP